LELKKGMTKPGVTGSVENVSSLMKSFEDQYFNNFVRDSIPKEALEWRQEEKSVRRSLMHYLSDLQDDFSFFVTLTDDKVVLEGDVVKSVEGRYGSEAVREGVSVTGDVSDLGTLSEDFRRKRIGALKPEYRDKELKEKFKEEIKELAAVKRAKVEEEKEEVEEEEWDPEEFIERMIEKDNRITTNQYRQVVEIIFRSGCRIKLRKL